MLTVWTCTLLMKFSQLLVPSHSFSVWEYNYTQNAYSSFCLPAAYSVRCISHEAEEVMCLCLYLSICQSVWLSVHLPLRLSWIRQQVTWWAGDHHPITKKKLETQISLSTLTCKTPKHTLFSCMTIGQCKNRRNTLGIYLSLHFISKI